MADTLAGTLMEYDPNAPPVSYKRGWPDNSEGDAELQDILRARDMGDSVHGPVARAAAALNVPLSPVRTLGQLPTILEYLRGR